jgi:hypothetical protein
MKHYAAISLSFAVTSILFLGAQSAHARSNGSMASMEDAAAPAVAMQEATQMVPADAALTQVLDARKVQAGQSFKATLSNSVQLKNGPKLPRGTVLVGTVVTNDLQANGPSKLALRFTKAELKSGESVPIKATIVGMAVQTFSPMDGIPNPVVNTWNDQTLQVDQIGALPGIDLHSNIASENSGVIAASSKKDDVKLGRSIHLSLAIAKQGNS